MPSGRPSPFADVRPAVGVAALYLLGVVVWIAAGAALPGGRWLAVHLFTLGVLSNLVLALTSHFASTLLHQPADARSGARLLLFNAGAVAVLAGVPTRNSWLLVAGAVATSAAVLWLYVALRRIRKAALGQRFAFVVRSYERAAGAFLHGAVLGGLIGGGLLPGSWAGAVRTAHLHVNVLGWGGLTLLATVVVFGPTVLRTRMQPGADELAGRWLRRGASALTVGVLALVVTGARGDLATAARVVAAGGLLGYTAAAVAVCVPVVRAAATARQSTAGLLMAAAATWFVVAAAVDVIVVLSGQWRYLTAAGALMLVGVLGQAIVSALSYFAPLLWRAGGSGLRRRLDRAALPRVAAYNLAVAAIGAGATLGHGNLATAGWAAALGWLAVHVASGAWPRGSGGSEELQKTVTEP